MAVAVPAERRPDRNTPLVYHTRATDTQSISERTGRPAHKEYNVCVYLYPDGRYGIIAFYGTIGSLMQSDWKGERGTRTAAINAAGFLMDGKLADNNKHYVRSEGINRSIPGIREPVAPQAPVPRIQPNPVMNPQPRPQMAPQRAPEFQQLRVYDVPEELNEVEALFNRGLDSAVWIKNTANGNIYKYQISYLPLQDMVEVRISSENNNLLAVLGGFEKRQKAVEASMQDIKRKIGYKEPEPVKVQQENVQRNVNKNEPVPYVDDDMEEYIASRKINLLKTAQPNVQPNARPEDFQHGNYDQMIELLNKGIQVPVGISTEKFLTYQVQRAPNGWSYSKGDGIYQALRRVEAFPTKPEAVNAVIADLHAEEDRYALQQDQERQAAEDAARPKQEEPEEPKLDDLHEVKKRDKKVNAPKNVPYVDDDDEDMIAKSKNWYKISQKNEKSLRRVSR